MSEEGDFMREFEDSVSEHQPGGFNRQQSKLSEAHKQNSGFYKQDSALGAVGTPQSSHIDFNRVESVPQADLPKLSLTDLKDDDKSSLESGQVSPEAFDARSEAPAAIKVNPPQGHHQRFPQGGPQGRMGGGPGDNKRMNKRRGRFSRSRSRSPKGFNDGGNNNQGGFYGGRNNDGQPPHFQEGYRGRGRGHHQQHGHDNFNEYGGGRGGRGRGRGNHDGQHGHQFGNNNRRGGYNNNSGGGNMQQYGGNDNGHSRMNNSQSSGQQNQAIEQLNTVRMQNQQLLNQAQAERAQIQAQLQLNPQHVGLQAQLKQATGRVEQQMYLLQYCQQQIVTLQQQQAQSQQQQQHHQGGRGGHRGGHDHGHGNQMGMDGGHHRGRGGRGGHFREPSYGNDFRGGHHRGRGGNMNGGPGGRDFNHRGRGGHMGGGHNNSFGNRQQMMGGYNPSQGPKHHHNNHHNNSQFAHPGDNGNQQHHDHQQMGQNNQGGGWNMHRQMSNVSMNSQGSHNHQMGTPRGGNQAKLPQSQAMLNARRFSIYIKNVPQEKFNIVEIDTFFSNFGEVIRVDRHPEKMAATVKFKDIESAEKAANFALQQRQQIWGDPQVQLIYNIAGAGGPRANLNQGQPGQSPHALKLKHQHSSMSSQLPIQPQLSEEELLKKKQLEDIRKQIAKKRQMIMERHNSEIQKGISKLAQPGLTEEQVKTIEAQIEASKTKMREIKASEEKEKQQHALQARQQKAKSMGQVVPQAAPQHTVEMKLSNIAVNMRQFNTILECLNAYSQVRDFKFTDDEKSTAYVKFLSTEPNVGVLIESIRTKLSALGTPMPFQLEPATQGPTM